MSYVGGLVSIANETLNVVNVVEAKIQVQKHVCCFIPSTIDISDEKKGNIFLNFGYIECLEPTIKVQGALFIKDIQLN